MKGREGGGRGKMFGGGDSFMAVLAVYDCYLFVYVCAVALNDML